MASAGHGPDLKEVPQTPPDQTPSDQTPRGRQMMTVGDKKLIAEDVLQKLPASGDPWTPSGADFWLDRVKGCIYGNCIGDAIGLLTEFMTKDKATKYYKKHKKLEYAHKVGDFHRSCWKTGDWTDDSDQMILIMLSATSKRGEIDPKDFAQRLERWRHQGYPELGDCDCVDIGSTTLAVVGRADFLTDPHKAASQVWEQTGRYVAPNGGVMRTSFLGIHHYDNLADVIWNTYSITKTTHADPRCIASCIAVTTAIAMMLQQRTRHMKKDGSYCVETIMEDAFCIASQFVDDTQKQELHDHMFAPDLTSLALSEPGKIGYTFKALGAGFWALRQENFREALTATTMEAGDADSNGAVAGALLGCKLGFQQLPKSWVSNLKHRDWLDQQIQGTWLTSFERGHLDFPGMTVKRRPHQKYINKELPEQDSVANIFTGDSAAKRLWPFGELAGILLCASVKDFDKGQHFALTGRGSLPPPFLPLCLIR